MILIFLMVFLSHRTLLNFGCRKLQNIWSVTGFPVPALSSTPFSCRRAAKRPRPAPGKAGGPPLINDFACIIPTEGARSSPKTRGNREPTVSVMPAISKARATRPEFLRRERSGFRLRAPAPHPKTQNPASWCLGFAHAAMRLKFIDFRLEPRLHARNLRE
jgi:hypothetical protein